MATGGKTNNPVVYLIEISHQVLDTISNILDQNDTWKKLGSEYFGLCLTDIFRYNKCSERGKSPTYEMLVDWAQQNHTVLELFKILADMKQYYAMKFLKNHVKEKYHYLMNDGISTFEQTGFFQSDPNKSSPEFPKPSIAYHFSKSLPKPPIPTEPLHRPSEKFSKIVAGASSSSRLPNQETAYGIDYGNIHSHCGSIEKSDQKLIPKVEVNPASLSPKVEKLTLVSSNNLNRNESGVSMASKQMGEYKRETVQEQPQLRAPRAAQQLNTPIASERDRSIEDNTKVPSENDESVQDWGSQRLSEPVPIHQPKESSPRQSKDLSSIVGPSMLPATPYREIVQATENFSDKRILGKGGFGVVYEGYWQNTKVAIKRIIKRDNPGLTRLEEAKLHQSFVELKALNKYRHDNILPLYGYSLSDDILCLIYQYMVNGSLEDRLLKKRGTPALNWTQRMVIACGSARGIQFLHKPDERIVHGDIKSANILLDGNFEPKIGDFGLARDGPKSQSTHTVVSAVHGTQPYLPADYIKDKKLSTKVDTYSFGVVLFELATGLRAYNDHLKPKFLRDYVIEKAEEAEYAKNMQIIDGIRDESAGSEVKEAFMEFVKFGRVCVLDRKSLRPEMAQVLELLENSQRILIDGSQYGISSNFSDGTNINEQPSAYTNSASQMPSDGYSISTNEVEPPPQVPVPNIPIITALGTKEPS